MTYDYWLTHSTWFSRSYMHLSLSKANHQIPYHYVLPTFPLWRWLHYHSYRYTVVNQSNPIFYRPSTACRPGPLKSSKYYQPGHLWPIFISPRTKFSQVQYWYQHCYYQTLTDYPSAAPNYTLNLHRIASCYDDSRQKSTVTSITIGLVNSVGLCLLHCRWDMR